MGKIGRMEEREGLGWKGGRMEGWGARAPIFHPSIPPFFHSTSSILPFLPFLILSLD